MNRNIFEESYDLPKLESFDPEVFIGDKKYSQRFCNLLLSLSVFCNDMKDLIMMLIATQELRPQNLNLNVARATTGQYCGLVIFIQRLFVLKIKEFSEIINDHKEEINGSEFLKLLQSLPKSKRECWGNIIKTLVYGTGQHTSRNSKFIKVLEIIRHKIGSHYDPSEISKGYKQMFIINKEICEPYLSRGESVGKTRFFYADAAAQGYYYKKLNDYKELDFDQELYNAIKNICGALWLLVSNFINSRSPFREQSLSKLPHMKEFKME